MSGYCAFVGTADAWRCETCGFVTRPAERPPRRRCQARVSSPMERDGRRRSPPYRFAACIHRGDELRHVPCGLCGARRLAVPVYACALLGECTLRRVARHNFSGACCLGCEYMTG